MNFWNLEILENFGFFGFFVILGGEKHCTLSALRSAAHCSALPCCAVLCSAVLCSAVHCTAGCPSCPRGTPRTGRAAERQVEQLGAPLVRCARLKRLNGERRKGCVELLQRSHVTRASGSASRHRANRTFQHIPLFMVKSSTGDRALRRSRCTAMTATIVPHNEHR